MVLIAPAFCFYVPVLPMLRAAVYAALLCVTAEGRYWFTHPLLSEILDGDLLPEQRRQMHFWYASVLDEVTRRTWPTTMTWPR